MEGWLGVFEWLFGLVVHGLCGLWCGSGGRNLPYQTQLLHLSLIDRASFMFPCPTDVLVIEDQPSASVPRSLSSVTMPDTNTAQLVLEQAVRLGLSYSLLTESELVRTTVEICRKAVSL
jgi:hypothetical protein